MANFEVDQFEVDVLEQSEKTPVLVDFWAPWCRPCLALSPVLEEAHSEADGKWALVKVNTEDRPELAHRFQIRSIPSLKLFINREIVSEQHGALPKTAILDWLAEFLPNPAKNHLAEATAALESGAFDRCEELSRALLEEQPENDPARLLLAQTLWSQSPQEAISILEPIQPDSDSYQTAEALRYLLAEIDCLREDASAPFPEGKGKEDWIHGIKEVGARNWESAFQAWIAGLEKDRNYREGSFQAGLKNLFILLGIRHPIASRYHRAFTSALYS